jgi:hypothetical protein
MAKKIRRGEVRSRHAGSVKSRGLELRPWLLTPLPSARTPWHRTQLAAKSAAPRWIETDDASLDSEGTSIRL